MSRLIWVFAGRTVTLFVLSCRGSHSVDLQLNETNITKKKKKKKKKKYIYNFEDVYEPRHEKMCFFHMRTTKTQISLRIWFYGSSLSLYLNRLVWVLAGRKPRRQVFSWRDSFYVVFKGLLGVRLCWYTCTLKQVPERFLLLRIFLIWACLGFHFMLF